jgi:uncharacterized protein YjiS (DUF1127 family)
MPCNAAGCSTVIPTIPAGDDFGETRARVPSPFAWVKALARWQERWRQRQCLRDLDDHMLRDIGLTRCQALEEAHRPFWM